MKVNEVAAQYNIDKYALERFLRLNNYPGVHENLIGIVIDNTADIKSIVSEYKLYTNKRLFFRELSNKYNIEQNNFNSFIEKRVLANPNYFDSFSSDSPSDVDLMYNDFLAFQNGDDIQVTEFIQQKAEADAAKQSAMAQMLISSGFTFEGYRIVKYSGYISGDDAIQVARGTEGFFTSATNVGESLMDSLKQMRRQALKELKEAAYDLGCNAIIGVDFDYITLEPETANSSGGTTYLPYVFGVTANGNAVIIEKIENA